MSMEFSKMDEARNNPSEEVESESSSNKTCYLCYGMKRLG